MMRNDCCKKALVVGIIVLFIGMSVVSSTGNISKISFVCKSNNPPYEPSNPNPPNGLTNNTICPPNFSWTGGDPDGDNVTYDVYFGIHDPFNDPPQVAENVTNTTYDPSHYDNLEFETKYDWKIVAWDEYGLNSSGAVWSFTTEANLPPFPPSNPFPENGAVNTPLDVILCWVGGDPNLCDTVTYDVYFGPESNPSLKEWDYTKTCYDPPYDLELYEDYFWRVVSRDSQGEITSGDEWVFSTGGPPHSPTDPIIDGANSGVPEKNYTFTFVSTNIDGHRIKYYVKWGDNSEVEVTEYYESGEVVSLNHSWDNMGEVWIEAMAEDEYYAKSRWTRFKFIVPRNKATYNSLFLWFLERFPLLEKLLNILE